MLGDRDKDGRSKFDQLTLFEQRTGKKHPDLIAPDVDDDALYLWGWYREIARRRDSTNGPKPLSWDEIGAWARMTGRDPEPWEMDVITEIDDAYLEYRADRIRAEKPTPKAKRGR